MNLQQPFLMPWLGLNPAALAQQQQQSVNQAAQQQQQQQTNVAVSNAQSVSPVQKMIPMQQSHQGHQQQLQMLSAAQYAQLQQQQVQVALHQQQMGVLSPGAAQSFIYPSNAGNMLGNPYLAAQQQLMTAANTANGNAAHSAAAAGMPKVMVQGSGAKDGSILAACLQAAAAAAAASAQNGAPNTSAAAAAQGQQMAQQVNSAHAHAAQAHAQAQAQAVLCASINGFVGTPANGGVAQTSALAANAAVTSLAAAAKFSEKRKLIEEIALADVKKAKLETKALKAKRPGFTDDRYNETAYYAENGLRKVYPYYFTFTTFTKGRWVGEKILEVFGREFRAHPVEEYERCIIDGTLTVNYDQVDVDYRLRHNDLLANIVHRHETPVLSKPIEVIHLSEDLVVLDKPCSLPVHPCGRYRHNTVVFILAKEYNLKNLRTIHRLDRLTSGLLMFGRNPKKARDMEQQIRNRQVLKEYVCRVDGEFPDGCTECVQPVEVVSYKIGVCKVSPHGKECRTEFERLNFNGKTSVVLCRPFTGRMHQIRVHLQYLGFPVINDPLYNHTVFGPTKGKGGVIGKSDDQLIQDLIAIHNAENWLGMDGDSELSMFNKDGETQSNSHNVKKDRSNKPQSSHNTPNGLQNGEKSPAQSNGIQEADKPVENGLNSVAANGLQQQPEQFWEFDAENPIESLEKNQAVPKNCTITRPPPITKPGRLPVVIRAPLETEPSEALTEQDNELLAKHQEYRYQPEKMTWDPNCYECKVRYRDPKPKDLVMYLHAWRYKGPSWQFQTRLPDWAEENWTGPDC